MAYINIVDKFPAENVSGVYINDIIWAQFSEPIDADTATYYNFTVNERDTYDPVEGEVSCHGVSGNLDNSVIVFVPTNGLVRNTRYMVLASTGLTSKAGDKSLDHDTVWYFETGNEAASGTIGDSVYDLHPSGFTELPASGSSPTASGLYPLEIVSTSPADYDTQVSLSVPHIAITFNDVLPSGFDFFDFVEINAKHIVG